MKQPKPETPKAVAALVAITDTVLQFRSTSPTLGDIARIAGRASGLLRMSDLDEKISVENAALLRVRPETSSGITKFSKHEAD